MSISDAAVEAGREVAPFLVTHEIVRDIITAAFPHLSPRPDAETERLREEAESNQSAYLHAAEGRASAERRLSAAWDAGYERGASDHCDADDCDISATKSHVDQGGLVLQPYSGRPSAYALIANVATTTEVGTDG